MVTRNTLIALLALAGIAFVFSFTLGGINTPPILPAASTLTLNPSASSSANLVACPADVTLTTVSCGTGVMVSDNNKAACVEQAVYHCNINCQSDLTTAYGTYAPICDTYCAHVPGCTGQVSTIVVQACESNVTITGGHPFMCDATGNYKLSCHCVI